VIAGFDAVTAEDIQRVAQDVIRDERLNLAVLGPFDDVDRFRGLLALAA
jgi:predicted Zn-dependent peptidase